MLDSRPSSSSRVRSGPRSALPTWLGVTAGLPSSPLVGSHVLTASNAPGALDDSPSAPRSLSVSHHDDGNHAWSESTYETPILGSVWSPKSLPNALFPSTRTPPVTNSRSFHDTCSCRKKPALITRRRLSSLNSGRAEVATSG